MTELMDFHAHFLPHMDHGSGSTATAREQLSLMQAAGVGTVCATSHFYPQDTLAVDFLSDRQKSLHDLLAAYGSAPRPSILLGAEVLICRGLENMEGLRDLCVEGTNVLLLEMPFTHDTWDPSLYGTVKSIVKRGITPVFAHVDRYPRELVERLFDMGLYGQLNTDSLARVMKPKHLLRWMDEGYIVALGSDIHGCDPKSYAHFSKVTTTMAKRTDPIMLTAAGLLKDAKRY